MNGNVEEWVEDCWNDSYEALGRPDDGSAWITGDCSRRVLRGGSWNYGPENLRSAFRFGYFAGYRYFDSGFRVARTLSRKRERYPLNLYSFTPWGLGRSPSRFLAVGVGWMESRAQTQRSSPRALRIVDTSASAATSRVDQDERI